MSMIVKNSRINIMIIFKARYIVSTYFFLIILIQPVELSAKRDLIFESKQLDTLTLFVSIVDNSLLSLIIRNDTNLSVTLVKHTRLDKVLKYKTEKCF